MNDYKYFRRVICYKFKKIPRVKICMFHLILEIKIKIFNDKINKNLAIIDIYTAYKKILEFIDEKILWMAKKIIFDYEMQHLLPKN